MELKDLTKVYFIGVGGIGMSALARYFLHRGCQVSGYDRTETDLTRALIAEGVKISYIDSVEEIPSDLRSSDSRTLIVYTPAIPKNSNIAAYFSAQGFTTMKRSQVLGLISKGQFCIAIAGTHGKTTTSSMTAHILTATGYGCTAFLGGIATNYNSNFLLGTNDTVVIEADEYDRSFLQLHPDIAVITSMDADHLDIYGNVNELEESFRLFAAQLKPDGLLITKQGLALEGQINYSAEVDTLANVRAENIQVVDSAFVFDYCNENLIIHDVCLHLAGKHNVENSLAAITIALKLGIDPNEVKKAVGSFSGIKRRFEYIAKSANAVYIDDYAHHPMELKACFHAVRQLYPGRDMTVIFQPHLFTRTRDFAAEFAEVLSTVDDLILLEIYPARELPIAGVDSQFLIDKVKLERKQILSKEQAIQYINDKRPEILLTVGAGDIDTMVQPLKTLLSHV